MNKICHLASSHARYDRRIFLKECQSLAKEGYAVSLIVADGKGYEVKDDISIFDVGVESSRLKRLILSPIKICKLASKLNSLIYHFHDPELIFTGFTLKQNRKIVIYDMHEDMPAHILDSRTIPYILKHVMSFIFKKVEIYAANRFDAIVSTRETINRRISKYNANIEIINNYPILEEIKVHQKSKDAKIISYAGGISDIWNQHEIIAAIESIDDIKYILAGHAEDSYLDRLKTLKGWTKVDYRGFLKYDEVKSIYMMTNYGVAVHSYCNNTDGRVGNLANTKIFEYMHWAIPVICTDYSLWKDIIVEKEKCGICVSPNDSDSIKNALQYLIDNPDIANEMGKNGRNAVIREYNWNTEVKKLVNLYRKII